jgi:hypothetical protein
MTDKLWLGLTVLGLTLVACDDGGIKETGLEEADTDTDTDADTDADADADADTDTDADPDELFVYYGWQSSFTIDASTSTGKGSENFFYFEPDTYADFICVTSRDGVATPSSYSCSECEFALSIDLSGSYYGSSIELNSGDDGCALIGAEFDGDGNLLSKKGLPDDGISRDGIGFASYYGEYSNVAVYYFPSYKSWYPIAYSEFDGSLWTYTYGPASWYTYVYY